MNVSKLLKFVLDFFKPAIDAKIGELKTNRDANIATIEATLGTGSTNVEQAIVAFVAAHLGHGPVSFLVQMVEAPLLGELAAAVAAGEATLPELYDRAVAFLEKEEAYL